MTRRKTRSTSHASCAHSAEAPQDLAWMDLFDLRGLLRIFLMRASRVVLPCHRLRRKPTVLLSHLDPGLPALLPKALRLLHQRGVWQPVAEAEVEAALREASDRYDLVRSLEEA